ncbi:large proline-rich protein bag6-like isoform X1 [Zingiber officinale]|uniref:large proline-rich protein bag6-like isoform X1 n=1 Tax=Zingiber officinale TaxID=94328 RepID=UPI001C4BE742|nr:large proline-rich protein bag6-like isoform X1 [Zingiber officinale]
MANDQSKCSATETSQSSDSTIQINVKSLDSQIYTFCLNKDAPIPSLKAMVANVSGIPVEQQRLIFRGKVLKDDQLLSDYHLEDGHTLHLVARPDEAQTQSGIVSGDHSNSGNQGIDASANAPPNRIGQVSHSVVLGTVNISDQREGMGLVPDIGRVVGAVLQSLGAGILPPVGSNNIPSVATNQAAPSNGTGQSQDATGRAQQIHQTQTPITLVNQLPFQVQLTSPTVLQPNMVIPDSLRTLSYYINRMELILQNSGSQSSGPSNTQNILRSDNTSLHWNRMPTPDVLGSVIDQARVLLTGHTATALSRMAERLRGEITSDPLVRSQIQTEAMHMGLVMQHLGAMLLELGRTTMMLRMGTPDGSFVNSGPAVYISSTGPNPIMPSPPQLNSVFTGSLPLVSGPNILNAGDILRNVNVHVLSGTSSAPGISSSGSREDSRDLNHSGQQNVGQASQTGHASAPVGNAAPLRGMAARTAVAAIPARYSEGNAGHVFSVAIPVHAGSQTSNPTLSASSQHSHPSMVSGSQPTASVTVPLLSSGSGSVPRVVAQENAHTDHASASTAQNQTSGCSPTQSISNTVSQQLVTEGSSSWNTCENVMSDRPDNNSDSANKNIETLVPDISTEDGKQKLLVTDGMRGPATLKPVNICLTTMEKPPEDKLEANAESSKAAVTDRTTPLGLGLRGLQPKKRSKVAKPVDKDGKPHDSSSASQNSESISRGQQLLRSIVSQGSDGNSTMNSLDSMPFGGQGSSEQIDVSDMVSQVLRGPSFNNILTNLAETGLGSTAALRNMMEQCTQSPAMMNTLNNMAQQVQDQDLGSMLMGSGGSQGGIDFSSMIRQMLPVVSQIIGRVPSQSPSVSVPESEPRSQSNSMIRQNKMQESKFQYSQIDLHEAQQRIEQNDSPGSIFRAMVESAGSLNGENDYEGLQELGDDVELSIEYSEILRRHIQQRLDKESKSKEKL